MQKQKDVKESEKDSTSCNWRLLIDSPTFYLQFGVESYLYYKNDSPGANDSLLYTFRAVAETVLY